MSIQRNHYIILGTTLPFPRGDSEEVYEKYEKFMDSAYKPVKEGFVILFDGMCGEYIIAGHVLASTNCDDDGPAEFDGIVKVEPTHQQMRSVRSDLESKLGIKDVDIKTIVVTHCR